MCFTLLILVNIRVKILGITNNINLFVSCHFIFKIKR